MSSTAIYVILAVVGILVGLVIGYLVSHFVASASAKRMTEQAQAMMDEAKRDAESAKHEALLEAKDEIYNMKQRAEDEYKELDSEYKERDKTLKSREDRLTQREESADRRVESLDAREHQLSSLQGQLDRKSSELDEALGKVEADLERIAGMTQAQAKEELLSNLKGEVSREAATIIRDSEAACKAECDKKSREILSLAIQRVAADHAAESTVSTVHIPSDEVKGRIIGREGRNIRAFEQLTGVSLIIDDTPESVTLSCFDPVRREIGRITLENLIADGRIHPARIEEMFNKATKLVEEQVNEAGKTAAFDAGVHDLNPNIVKTLGRLKYRTSFGQNVLAHSLEVSALAGVMASELGLDPTQAKRAGLLHDLGKAIDHEVDGPHAVIGADLARRYNESKAIVHAIEAHHGDVEPSTIVAVLVQAADAVSAARPGARRESIENYIKRLEKLEGICMSHDGVSRAFAMQAGREIRVMVEPEKISDSDSVVIAHDIARQIEDEMEYPGQIKVVVIRESRSVDYAK